MAFWHLLLLGNVIIASLGQYLSKVMIHRKHVYQIMFYQYIASIITVTTYISIFKPDTTFSAVPKWLIIIGFMYAIGISSLYRAKRESLSKSSLFGRAKTLIPIILAVIFLGEWQLISPTTNGLPRLIGLILAIIAFYLFSRKETHAGSEKSFNYTTWLKWISVNVIFIGVAQFIVKYAVSSNEPLQVLRLQYFGSFTTIAILALATGKSLDIGWKNIIGSMLIGVFISTGLSLIYTALSLSSATQVFAIASLLTIVVVVSMGVVGFKEKFTKKMIIPFILALISIYLLK